MADIRAADWAVCTAPVWHARRSCETFACRRLPRKTRPPHVSYGCAERKYQPERQCKQASAASHTEDAKRQSASAACYVDLDGKTAVTGAMGLKTHQNLSLFLRPPIRPHTGCNGYSYCAGTCTRSICAFRTFAVSVRIFSFILTRVAFKSLHNPSVISSVVTERHSTCLRHVYGFSIVKY